MTAVVPAPPELSRIARWCLVVGSSLIVLFGALFVAGIAGLAIGIDVGWWLFVPAIAAQAAFAWIALARLELPRSVVTVAVTLAVCWFVILGAGLASRLVTDHSVDGRHYHSETAWAIANGWNPVRDGPLIPSDNPYQPDATTKGIPVLSATVLTITDDIDTTRLVGFALLVAAALVAIAALEAVGASTWLAVGAGLVLAANPVALTQLGTAMVDGIVSSLLLATLMLALLWLWRCPPVCVLPPLAAALVLLVNTKFTGLVYVGLIVLPLLLVAGLLRGDGRRLIGMLGSVLACTIVAMVVLGYNPYVTNTLRHGNPLHPNFGPDSRDIGAQYRTGMLRNASEPERLLLATFGASKAGASDPDLKLPLTFSRSEWSAFRSSSVRIGGFGPWFSAGLLLAGAALAASLLSRRSNWDATSKAALAVLAAGVICWLATVVQPSSFLARFAPQLWFVAPLVATAVLLAARARVARVIAYAALGLLLVNAFGVWASATAWNVRDTRRENTSLARLRANAPLEAQFTTWRIAEARRLRDNGVRFRAVRQLSCKKMFVFSVSGALEVRRTKAHVAIPNASVRLCPVAASSGTGDRPASASG